MSAYSHPAPPPAAVGAATADPTAVVGRRLGAIVVDGLRFTLIMAFVGPTPLSPLAEYYEVPDGVDDVCETVRDAEDVSSCVEIGDRVYFTEEGDAAIQIVVWLAFVGLYAALQGATGLTPGKAVFGIKVVDERGGTPGFGRSLGRTALWVTDAAPWCLPLVGFITGLTSKGHRRIGDMAVKTFVVRRAHAGPVVVPGMATVEPYGPTPGPGWWAPPGTPSGGGWGAPPSPSGPPPGWGPPTTGGYPPAGAPGSTSGPGSWPPPWPTPSGPPTPGEPADARPAPSSGARPGSEPAPPASTTPSGEAPAIGETAASAGPPHGAPADHVTGEAEIREPDERAAEGADAGPPGGAGTAGTAGYNPQWDAARGTYIVWEPQRGQWLGWDEASKQWRPL